MEIKKKNSNIHCSVTQCKHNMVNENYCGLDCICVGTHESNPTVPECTNCDSFVKRAALRAESRNSACAVKAAGENVRHRIFPGYIGLGGRNIRLVSSNCTKKRVHKIAKRQKKGKSLVHCMVFGYNKRVLKFRRR